MPHNVSFDKENGIVQVTFSDSAARDEHAKAFDVVLQLCRKYDCLRVLVDFSSLSTSNLSTIESFSFGEVVAKNPLNLSIAHVLPRHDKARENILFASTVEANRGKLTGTFETVKEARDWLLNKT